MNEPQTVSESEPLFSVGEKVSMEQWDSTVPPLQRFGVATVQWMSRTKCESGWMYAVTNGKGLLGRFDQGWLTKIDPGTTAKDHE